MSNCPYSSLQAFPNVNNNNKIYSLQNLLIFLSNHSKLGVMPFMCVMQKNITPSDGSDGNVSEFAVTAVYSSLIFMSSSDRKTHWVFQITAKKKGSTDFILRLFLQTFSTFVCLFLALWGNSSLAPFQATTQQLGCCFHRALTGKEQRQKAQWGELKVASKNNSNIQHWRTHSAIYQYTFNPFIKMITISLFGLKKTRLLQINLLALHQKREW